MLTEIPDQIVINRSEIEVVIDPYYKYIGPEGYKYESKIPSFMIKGPWDPAILSLMKDNEIRGLYINYAKGWDYDNFNFLDELEDLHLLSIISKPVDSLGGVGKLSKLESLSLSCHWKDTIDLSELKSLRHCFVGWSKGADSVFECRALQYLHIDEFKIKDYSGLSQLENMHVLTISNSDFSDINVLSNMQKIKKLSLENCKKLESLKGIEKLKSLEWLNIDGCKKISKIDEVSELTNLKFLQFRDVGEIECIKPIHTLRNLEVLSFYGTTNIVDGDLEVIESLDRLSLVGFNNKRHYTHKPCVKWDWKSHGAPRKVVQKK